MNIHRLAGLLIEEQNAVKNFLVREKNKFLACTGATESDYGMLLKKIDDNIEYNQDTRPYYITKLFIGDYQVREIRSYNEMRLDFFVKEIEKACSQSKINNITVNHVGNGASQVQRLSQDPSVQSTPEKKTESAPRAIQSVNNKLLGDKIDDNPNAEPNTKEDAADKAANRSWQDSNGFVHHPDGSVSSGPVD